MGAVTSARWPRSQVRSACLRNPLKFLQLLLRFPLGTVLIVFSSKIYCWCKTTIHGRSFLSGRQTATTASIKVQSPSARSGDVNRPLRSV